MLTNVWPCGLGRKSLTSRVPLNTNRSRDIYAWEERGSHTEITGLGIERFTEGRRWSPSRVRDVQLPSRPRIFVYRLTGIPILL